MHIAHARFRRVVFFCEMILKTVTFYRNCGTKTNLQASECARLIPLLDLDQMLLNKKAERCL